MNFREQREAFFREKFPNATYSLTPDQIKAIVIEAVNDAYDSMHWGDSIDWEVLWIRIARYIETGSFK